MKFKMNWKTMTVCFLLALLGTCLAVQWIRCANAVKEGKKRLASCGARTVSLSYGKMAYADAGEGEVILSVHGIFGGYDQALDVCKDFVPGFRVLAPSRFGYPGSEISGKGTPAEQATAFAELLDQLGIDKVYLLSVSAGGSVAIRFALDYPERTKGLILYCSAMPCIGKPDRIAEYAGPPAFFCKDYLMFLMSPLFDWIMGMDPSAINGKLPVGERKNGVILDASVTNTDMARNYEKYPVEKMRVPVLILHAKDDRLASYEAAWKARERFPDCTFVSFETGGHLLAGHEEEIKKAVLDFTRRNG